MTAIHPPAPLYLQVVLKVQEKVGAGHDAAGEEVPGHPVALVLHLEVIGQCAVGKDMHQGHGAGVHPGGHLGEEALVVLHVLEHLDRDHAVKVGVHALEGKLRIHHIGREDGQVGQAALAGERLDERPLAVRVGQTHHLRAREALGHPQAHAAPAATQVQDALPVVQSGALGIELEHRLFRLGQALLARFVPRTGVLQARAQVQVKKLGRHLIVLLVGRIGFLGDRTLAQLLHQSGQTLRSQGWLLQALIQQALLHQAAHARAHQGIGQQAPLAGVDQGGAQAGRQGRGVRWRRHGGQGCAHGRRLCLIRRASWAARVSRG